MITKFEAEKFLKMPWTEALDLGGKAYIPSSEMHSLVVGVFRNIFVGAWREKLITA